MSYKKLPYFELRNGTANTLVFIVKTTDLTALRDELARRYDATPGFFANDAVLIDVRRLGNEEKIPVTEFIALLNEFHMHPVGIVATGAQQEWAGGVLPFLELHERRDAGITSAVDSSDPQPVAFTPEPAANERIVQHSVTTIVIDKPLRSGQQIYAGGDLVVLGQVSFGAELIAAGSIHIYAPLHGRALAGVHGDHDARIFCTCFMPELIAIAGIYRTAENPLPDDMLGKPVQVRLNDEKLIIESLRLT